MSAAAGPVPSPVPLRRPSAPRRASAARRAAPAVLALLAAAAGAGADAPELSGTLVSSAAASAGAGGAAVFSMGWEEYCNLRLKAAAGERGTVYAAANLVAASGSYLPPAAVLAQTAFVAGENYAAALELERLYLRIRGEALDFEAGLLRLSLGYGPAWRPVDFLSPPNPLVPDARPRGLLGAVVSAYPSGTSRIKAFLAAPTDPRDAEAEGTALGVAGDVHGGRASLLGLYAFRTPEPGYPRGRHIAGLSAKLEAGAGFVLDALYEWNPDAGAGWNGLRAAVGADYSLFGGDLYVLGQYLYNGPGALDPGDDVGDLYDSSGDPWYETAPAERLPAPGVEPSAFNRRNYLLASFLYRFGDYTRATLSCAACLDDLSFLPSLTVEHEPFQGLAVSGTVRVPLDARSLSGSGGYGELGPANSGSRGSVTLSAKLRF